MKSIRTRMTVIFVGLMMAMIAVIWGINKWYLEKYYITEKVESIEAAYDAFNWQLESNAERGISIQEAMKREQDADGNIKEGNLQKLFRDAQGCGVIEFFSTMKIDTAKQMIRDQQLNFTQISDKLGYTSIHYFSRQFKKLTAMTPSEYATSIRLLSEKPS